MQKILLKNRLLIGLESADRNMQRIEKGVNSITLDILSKVAEVLGVTVGDITKVLDETPAVTYRAGEESGSLKKILDMLDLFYANKHMSEKLQHRDRH